MKTIKLIITWFKDDPKDAICSTLLILSAFALLYGFLWLGAIFDGNC